MHIQKKETNIFIYREDDLKFQLLGVCSSFRHFTVPIRGAKKGSYINCEPNPMCMYLKITLNSIT